MMIALFAVALWEPIATSVLAAFTVLGAMWLDRYLQRRGDLTELYIDVEQLRAELAGQLAMEFWRRESRGEHGAHGEFGHRWEPQVSVISDRLFRGIRMTYVVPLRRRGRLASARTDWRIAREEMLKATPNLRRLAETLERPLAPPTRRAPELLALTPTRLSRTRLAKALSDTRGMLLDRFNHEEPADLKAWLLEASPNREELEELRGALSAYRDELLVPRVEMIDGWLDEAAAALSAADPSSGAAGQP